MTLPLSMAFAGVHDLSTGCLICRGRSATVFVVVGHCAAEWIAVEFRRRGVPA